MTLCAAWIREKSGIEELIFATDSTLTGGEKWNQGVKLFELPRPDCLICFAGSTARAYPLILNLISSIKLNKRLSSSHTDISEVLDYLSSLFTTLVSSIKSEIPGEDIHALRADAKFLFGGWSWLENRFRIWKLYYSEDAEGFIPFEYTGNRDKTRSCAFLGDPADPENDMEGEATKRYRQEFDNEKFDDKLDLEPLRILIEISRDAEIREVDGAIQIAKVYKSGTSEFFGIYWPSSAGTPHFQGREFNRHTRPEARYFDPDTLELVEDQLPILITDMQQFASLEDYGFIQQCYDEQGGLKINLKTTDRERLMTVFRAIAYSEFVQKVNGVEQDE